MSDILKITLPPKGYENSTKNNPINVNDKTIQNIVDPTKVSRGDGKDGYDDSGRLNNYESNYESFLQNLKSSQYLSKTLKDIIFSQMITVVNSGVEENYAEGISEFMELMKMNEQEFSDFLQNLLKSSVKFKGDFFDVLRNIINSDANSELKTNVLLFLKKYDDMSSGSRILNNIIRTLNDISTIIPRSYGRDLVVLLEKLNQNAKNGDTDLNSSILKNEIIPFLSEYIKRTRNVGHVRDLITSVILNIARYENGEKSSLEAMFDNLLGYSAIKKEFKNISSDKLWLLLQNTDYENSKANLKLIDKLGDIIKEGMLNKAGFEAKEVFTDITRAFLLNESVYMPFIHLTIPVNVNGKLMFSELWIDADEEKKEKDTETEKNIKILIKFDIKNLGFFDLIINYKNDIIDMNLFYPERLSSNEKTIKTEITDIIKRNGLKVNSLQLEKSIRPKTVSEVFSKIYERKNSINVRI